jgi:PPOX class probable F420-dependent enzyme
VTLIEVVSVPSTIAEVPESHRDLLEAPLIATLTTVDAACRPQSTAVWYLVDEDGQLKGSVTSERQKFKNLSGNPNCALFITDPQNPYRTLEIRAVAQLEADPDQRTVAEFAGHYGVDEATLIRADEDRYTVLYSPRRVIVTPPPG